MEENKTPEAAPKGNSMMMAVVGVIALVILAGAGYWFMQKGASKTATPPAQTQATVTQTPSPTETVTQATSPTTGTTSTTGVMEKGTVKTFDVAAKSFSFTPAEIRVKKGDTVKIVLTNSGGMHNWVIDEFNAKTKTIAAGATDTVEFTASKVGTFEYYCSVGNHRQMGMVGKLIVE